MLLSARMLDNVANVNTFSYVDQIEYYSGDPKVIYFQLIDASKNKSIAGFNPSGMRYVPAAGATLSVEFVNIDDSKKTTKTATQPYSGDLSIWTVSLGALDTGVSGTVSIKLTLTESPSVRHGIASGVVLAHSATVG